VVKDLVLLWCLGLRPVLVHGGGPEINKWLNKLNIEPNFSPSGLRVTDKDTMDVRRPLSPRQPPLLPGCCSHSPSCAPPLAIQLTGLWCASWG
jgi:hypothetical protein